MPNYDICYRGEFTTLINAPTAEIALEKALMAKWELLSAGLHTDMVEINELSTEEITPQLKEIKKNVDKKNGDNFSDPPDLTVRDGINIYIR